MEELESRSDEGCVDEEDKQKSRCEDGSVCDGLALGRALDQRLGRKELKVEARSVRLENDEHIEAARALTSEAATMTQAPQMTTTTAETA